MHLVYYNLTEAVYHHKHVQNISITEISISNFIDLITPPPSSTQIK
jgi:hypothetical protein